MKGHQIWNHLLLTFRLKSEFNPYPALCMNKQYVDLPWGMQVPGGGPQYPSGTHRLILTTGTKVYPGLQPNCMMVYVENIPSLFSILLPVYGSLRNPFAGVGSEHHTVKYDKIYTTQINNKYIPTNELQSSIFYISMLKGSCWANPN